MAELTVAEKHFMNEAFAEAELALKEGEVPVGCVFVSKGGIVARGRNAVNATHNACRHAEFNCIDQVLARHGLNFDTFAENISMKNSNVSMKDSNKSMNDSNISMKDSNVSMKDSSAVTKHCTGSHKRPATDSKTQFVMPEEESPSPNSGDKFVKIFSEISVYVTVEPCAMCADALGRCGVVSVTYGCSNDRFGGCGSVVDVPKIFGYRMKLRKDIDKERAVGLLKDFYNQENPNTANDAKKKLSRKKLKWLREQQNAAGCEKVLD